MPIEASYAISTANELEQSQATQSEQKSSGDFAELLAQEEANDTAFAETATLAEASEYASAATETLNQAAVAESDEGKTETSESSLEKPCIAQFMVMTGCDFKTATKALYQYENWQDYLNDENRSIPDLSQAQQQLQAERQSGARSMVDGSYGQYAVGFRDGGYLFHSVCYTQKDRATMMADEYNMLGDFASAGCVRLQVADAKWIFENCEVGTGVTVYDSPEAGALGKPAKAVEAITEENDNGWDPTDPDPYNPWHTSN